MRKFLIIIGLCFLTIFIYHLDAFLGHLKFTRLCEEEAGSMLDAEIERNVGRLVDEDPYAYLYKAPFNFGDVAFVRWRNKKGEWLDIRFNIDKSKQGQPEFTFAPIDQSLPVKYRYRYIAERFRDDERFSRVRHDVIELGRGRLFASHTDFSYEWTTPDRTILAMPLGISCNLKQDTFEKFARSIYARE